MRGSPAPGSGTSVGRLPVSGPNYKVRWKVHLTGAPQRADTPILKARECLHDRFSPVAADGDLVAHGLAGLEMVHDRDRSDPLVPRRTSRYDAMIGEFLERAHGRPDLVARGLPLRTRLHDVGIVPAGALFTLGVKR
jgi:hypothetical protein